MIVRKIKVNEYEYQPPINYVAGATEPDIQFQITDYVIPSGAEARAFVQRFDGTFEYTVATIDDQNITIEPTSSMFSVKGEGAIQVTLYVGDEIVKNFSVPVFVHADLADDAAQEGRDIVSIFHESEQAALEQFREDAEEIAEEVIESIPSDYTALSNEVDELNERLVVVEHGAGLTDEIKVALLQLAEKVAYVDEDGQDYYDALQDALYPAASLLRISAVYTQSGTVYDTDSLDDLKSDLVVTAHYSDGQSATVSTYTLTGTLTAGESVITVTYGGKTTTFSATITKGFLYTPSKGLLSAQAYIDVTNTDLSRMTETISDDTLIFAYTKGSTASGTVIYKFSDAFGISTLNGLMVELQFYIADIGYYATNNTSASGIIDLVSRMDSELVLLGIARYGSVSATPRLRIVNSDASSVAWKTNEITLNAWHTLTYAVESNKMTIALDGTNVVQNVNLGDTSASDHMRLGIFGSNTNPLDFRIRKFEVKVSNL